MCLCEGIPCVCNCPQRHEERIGSPRVADGLDFSDLGAVH